MGVAALVLPCTARRSRPSMGVAALVLPCTARRSCPSRGVAAWVPPCPAHSRRDGNRPFVQEGRSEPAKNRISLSGTCRESLIDPSLIQYKDDFSDLPLAWCNIGASITAGYHAPGITRMCCDRSVCRVVADTDNTLIAFKSSAST